MCVVMSKKHIDHIRQSTCYLCLIKEQSKHIVSVCMIALIIAKCVVSSGVGSISYIV